MLQKYRHTVAACCIGYVTQAVINNFAPLLFITFNTSYSISLELIGTLVAINFGIQLLIDILAAKFVDKIGYRISIIAAHIFAATGLISLAILPDLLPAPFAGLAISVVLYGIGGGMIETLVSPIVEACPTSGKCSFMSFLHSFYCWGSVLVILASTLFFYIFGIEIWKIVSICWAAVPVFNAIYFIFVPIDKLSKDGKSMTIAQLFRTKIFWLCALLMTCAGASELAISQWASAFAENGLKVTKAVGDIAGPCLFAVCMGISRIMHAQFGHKISLKKYIGFCAVLCVCGYLVASLVTIPVVALIGCGICGLAVGIMWPGVFSIAAAECPQGGTALFALLALAGDLGCMTGPSAVGFVSSAVGGNLRTGLLLGTLFPLLLFIGIMLLTALQKKQPKPSNNNKTKNN